jgi:DNA-binding NtrC family response regulator
VVASTLLIDDDRGFVESIAAAFSAEGIPIDVRTSWDSGVEAFRIGMHELVIADYNLPGSRHGLKLLGEVSQMWASARLVLISGAVTPTAEDLLGTSGLIDRFVPKSADLITTLIEEAIQAAARAAGPTSWQDAARSHGERRAVDEAALDAVDSALSSQLGS